MKASPQFTVAVYTSGQARPVISTLNSPAEVCNELELLCEHTHPDSFLFITVERKLEGVK